jgi:N-acetyl sugar amidotransferase
MKVLFLSTTSFPFGYSEPLLVDLIKYTRDFDKVIILQPKYTSSQLICDLPSNVEIVQLIDYLNVFDKLKGLFLFFHPAVSEERLSSKKRGLSLGINHWKVMLNYLSLALKNKKTLKGLIGRFAYEFTQFYFYSYWCTEATLAASILKDELPGLTVISRMHAYDLYEERHQPNYLPFRSKIFSAAANLVFVSEQGLNYFINRYPFLEANSSTKFTVGRLGVFKDREDVLSPISSNSNTFVIVSCSSLIPLKRIHLIIEALSKVSDISIHWVHFGDGKLIDELKELAKTTLISSNISFNFKGFVLNDEIKSFYETHQVDLFINTSLYEGLPISMMEAMSFGVPCIGTDVGGVSEIIHHDSNGYLLPVNFENHELTEKIVSYLKLVFPLRLDFQKNAFNTWKQKFHGLNNLMQLRTKLIVPVKECQRCLFNSEMYVNISFDAQGVCNVCQANQKLQEKTLFDEKVKEQKLNELLSKIKKKSSNKYDCLIGLSGGVDSSYVALKAKEWGLNPLILHVDNGWNSELATMNIENIIKKLGFDLYTYVINWVEMKDLQLSFLKSSVVDIDLPMDNAIMAIQFKIAKKFGIKHILSGVNTATEGWMPTDFSHYKLDSLNIRSIQRRFGSVKLATFPTVNPISFLWNTRVKKIHFCAPLDYIDYNKNEAKEILISQFGWRDYGGKHYENVYTKFYQGIILPQKFHFDKRISHLSVLISSGQLTKPEAIELMKEPAYNSFEYNEDKLFFCKKIGITEVEFDELMGQAPKSHLSYTSYVNIINRLIKLKNFLSFN